jgi:hypothetical protein
MFHQRCCCDFGIHPARENTPTQKWKDGELHDELQNNCQADAFPHGDPRRDGKQGSTPEAPLGEMKPNCKEQQESFRTVRLLVRAML